uniref:Uncharacterized protein n=1 Tax=Romanomermis culicivorax TaxID=13658 RepID=A0A915KGZ7_ROMCU
MKKKDGYFSDQKIQPRSLRAAIFETNIITHFGAQLNVQFFGHASRHRHGGHSTRLRTSHAFLLARPVFGAHEF